MGERGEGHRRRRHVDQKRKTKQEEGQEAETTEVGGHRSCPSETVLSPEGPRREVADTIRSSESSALSEHGVFQRETGNRPTAGHYAVRANKPGNSSTQTGRHVQRVHFCKKKCFEWSGVGLPLQQNEN